LNNATLLSLARVWREAIIAATVPDPDVLRPMDAKWGRNAVEKIQAI